MKLPSIKKAVKRFMKDPEQLAEDQQQAKLEENKRELREAMEEHETFRAECATYDALYGGTKSIRPLGSSELYVSDRYRDDSQTTEDARQVVNIVFQLVESSIDVNLPVPAVEAKEETDSEIPEETEDQQDPNNKPKPKQPSRRDMIEGQLAYMAADTSMRRMNTENERIVKKNGIGFFKVGYNPDFKAHTYRGRIETSNPHPGNVVLQPGVFRIKDMDRMWHIENRTIDYICREYGEEFREQLEAENLEYGQLDYFNAGTDYTRNDKTKKLSVVEKWYKDKDGDVGVYSWVGDTELRDTPKFFYKRDAEGNIIEYDEVKLPDGRTVQVKCHVPDQFPFIIWFNIPREKSARGLSDPYIIFDQQEAIKKVMSNEEKKLMEGTTKIFVRKGSGAAGKITNATLQIIETEDPINDVVTRDLKTPDNALKDYYMIMVQAAKDALGITEASQGRAENANLSGRALEQLAAQTQGRMGVKAEEKDIAYTELYRMWYDFLLAFGDSRMPYRADGKDSKPIYGFWDKGLLVKQDDAGEWYYPEFDIYVQAETALPKDKRFILDIANKAGNRLDNVGYWMLMEAIGVPQASAILEMEQAKLQQPPPQNPEQIPGMNAPPPLQPSGLQGGQMQGQINIPPNMSTLPDPIQQAMGIIQQLPPEQQAQMMQMLQTNPEQAMMLLQEIMGGQQQI